MRISKLRRPEVPDLVPVRRHDRSPARRQEALPRPAREPFVDPFGDFDEMWNRMVSRFFAPWGNSVWGQDWAPPVDIEETDDAWIFEVDLPGARREDLQVDIRDGELAISGNISERERTGVVADVGGGTGVAAPHFAAAGLSPRCGTRRASVNSA